MNFDSSCTRLMPRRAWEVNLICNISTCAYNYIYIHTHVCTHTHIYICTYMYTYMYMYTYRYRYMWMCKHSKSKMLPNAPWTSSFRLLEGETIKSTCKRWSEAVVPEARLTGRYPALPPSLRCGCTVRRKLIQDMYSLRSHALTRGTLQRMYI